MDEFIKFNNQTSGRDKLFRLAQYASRIIWSNLQQRSPQHSHVESIEKFKKVDELLGLMRRLLRFGRFVDTFQSTFSVLTLNNTILRLTSSLSRISNTCFMLMDHIVCLDKLKLLSGRWKIDASKWDRWSTKFWLYSILLGLVRDGYEVFKIYCEEMQRKKIRNTRKSNRSVGTANANNSAGDMPERNIERFDESCPASRCAVMEMEVEKSTREIRQRFNLTLQQIVLKYFARLHEITKWLLAHSDITIDTTKNLCDLPISLNSLGMIRLKPTTIGYLGVIGTCLSALPQINPMLKMVPAM